ncbi:MAG TPA: hypothetical protein VFP84_03715 [Kofleriaceae bacterium]|nr:hypothetical protein [Kofleriaceae bacterium]
MRFAVFALMACLSGCSLSPTDSGSECATDSQCGDDVCARTGECLARSAVRSVRVEWTIDGSAPAQAACADHPDLYLQFDGAEYGDAVRFAPVACAEGSFFVDKLPLRYQQVEMGVEGGRGGDAAVIDPSSARAKLDLFPVAE